MSATLQAQLFQDYFAPLQSYSTVAPGPPLQTYATTPGTDPLAGDAKKRRGKKSTKEDVVSAVPPPPLFVGARRFRVETVFLETLTDHLPKLDGAARAATAKMIAVFEKMTNSSQPPRADVPDEMFTVLYGKWAGTGGDY